MAKTKHRRRAKARRAHRRKRQVDSAAESVIDEAAQKKMSPDADMIEDREERGTSILTHAVRAVGIVPIVLLVVVLGSHQLWPGAIPHWFQPILDKEVAVLTLSAGHLAIIGLLIGNRGRSTWSDLALLTAAIATAFAGYRTIGDSIVGQVVALALALLIFPAVWAEWFSARTRRFWAFARTLRGISAIAFVLGVAGMVYYQSKDQNYIRDFVLVPLAVLAGIAVATLALWVLLRLIHRYAPILVGWLGSQVAAVYKHIQWRWGKPGD